LAKERKENHKKASINTIDLKRLIVDREDKYLLV